MDVYSIFGWVGMLLIVGAYGLISIGVVESSNTYYQFMNLLGAVGMLVNVFHTRTWSAVALQLIWGFIAIWAILKTIL